ncbi:MAG: hypothetical protein JST26_14980 [Bacteroidetes bacterium]|nr:hypothetical protein [Bacteroidota bacterium]
MLSPRIYLTFLILALSLLLQGSKAVRSGQRISHASFKIFEQNKNARVLHPTEELRFMYADLDEEDQDPESGFHVLAAIPVSEVHNLNLLHFYRPLVLRNSVGLVRSERIPLSILYSVWRL